MNSNWPSLFQVCTIWIKVLLYTLNIHASQKIDSGGCCLKVIISGSGAVKELHEDKLGIYEFYGISNNRSVYKMGGKVNTGYEYYVSWTNKYSSKFTWTVS